MFVCIGDPWLSVLFVTGRLILDVVGGNVADEEFGLIMSNQHVYLDLAC